MNIDNSVIKQDEKAVFALRSLYEKYGYMQYKMNKFEEYDLYLRNKDFLVSDHIITFTDTDGKLMALKPDVTLSIVKNGDDSANALQKVYYNENVYRVSKSSHSFREIMQVGLECVGNIDRYCIYEVLSLAAKSLGSISDDYVLDVSHMGIIFEVLDSLAVTDDRRKQLLQFIGEKNTHDISEIDGSKKLQKLIATYGSAESVRSMLAELYPDGLSESAEQLLTVVSALEQDGFGGKIRIDFSVLNDCNYYNGIVFKGFVDGIPTSILSGGQYDPLMHKLGRKAQAIGFAVYLDLLGQFAQTDRGSSVDTVILYNDETPLQSISSAVQAFSEHGDRVVACRELPPRLNCRQLVKLDEKGAFTIEKNA